MPWGRSLAEYQGMFALSAADLERRILDCAGGPASFNAELTRQGGRVVSCDPLYGFSGEQIATRIAATHDTIVRGLHATRDHFVWDQVGTPEALGQQRQAAMAEFLADLPAGLAAGRYVEAALPVLPFGDRSFDLALCGHLLFTYDTTLDLDFHHAAITELLRLAPEVRIFPLLPNYETQYSRWVEPVVDRLQQSGYQVKICPAAYEFQKGGNEFLRIFADI